MRGTVHTWNSPRRGQPIPGIAHTGNSPRRLEPTADSTEVAILALTDPLLSTSQNSKNPLMHSLSMFYFNWFTYSASSRDAKRTQELSIGPPTNTLGFSSILPGHFLTKVQHSSHQGAVAETSTGFLTAGSFILPSSSVTPAALGTVEPLWQRCCSL